MKRISKILVLIFLVILTSACKDEDKDAQKATVKADATKAADATKTDATKASDATPAAPQGAKERAASKLVVEETVVEGIILPEYYEFDYPEDFRTFMDSCIESSKKEDMEALASLCGFGGTNQDAVKYVKQCCLDGIGSYQYSVLNGGWGLAQARGGRKLWHYSFWYEGYRCVLYFLSGEGAKYEWVEFWLIPNDGKGYACFFYPGNTYHSDEEHFLVMDCENGLFEGEFTDKLVTSDYEDAMRGTVKHGLLDGVCTTEGTCYRYENGRVMESWPASDPSRVTDVDGYYLNLPDHFYTVGQRRCRYEKSDKGMIWDPF